MLQDGLTAAEGLGEKTGSGPAAHVAARPSQRPSGQSALPAPARRRVREGGPGLQNEKRKEFGYDFYKLLKHRQPK